MSIEAQIFLVVIGFFTSTLSTVMGLGGGLILQGFMSLFMGPSVIIPLHGVIQLASNFSRTLLLLEFIKPKILGIYIVGSLVGAALARNIVLDFSDDSWFLIMGVFILLFLWAPKPKKVAIKGAPRFMTAGFLSTFLTFFVGGTGPVQAPFFLNQGLKKEELIGNQGACQCFTHFIKVVVFFSIGFAFQDYWIFLLAMVISSIGGSYFGRYLLGRVEPKIFLILFRTLVTLLAIRMVLLGVNIL